MDGQHAAEFIISQYAAELIIGILLMTFGLAFRNWVTTIRESTKEILTLLNGLSKEFHTHVVETENRVTKVEEKVLNLERSKD